MKILFINYAKPPIADILYQVDQILTIYFYLLLYNKMNPKEIILCGDSAGGGLCTLFIQKLSLFNLSKIHPLGIILFSPWIDLTMSADSWLDAQYHDLIVDKSYVSRSGLLAVGNDPNNLTSPFFSAIYVKKYICNSNVLIFVSKHECLYDDAQKLVETLRENNNFIEYDNDNPANKGIGEKELIYNVKKFLPHVWPIFYSVFPEANDSMNQVCQAIIRWSSNLQNSSFVLK